MANESEKIESVGLPDPALPTSPILHTAPILPEGANNVSYDWYYNGKKYSNGSLICQEGELLQCLYGSCIDQSRKCGHAE
jgi:hypothetical protein